MVEPLLLTTARLSTFQGRRLLTGATGFFFERDGRLYLVTSRHVVFDDAGEHRPDRLEIELHDDPSNLARASVLSVLLYADGKGIWREGKDAGGDVDVAVIELDRKALPANLALQAFTPRHLLPRMDDAEVGQTVLFVGFPLGFHDGLHHLPVARHAVIASSFGLRFQGQGYFLTDGRTHRGISGAPVVMRASCARGSLPWTLLGVHSSSMDMRNRDAELDESLGLNCVWYADILLTLTAPD